MELSWTGSSLSETVSFFLRWPCIYLLDLVYHSMRTIVQNLQEMSRYPIEAVISHRQSDNTDMPSPIRVLEVSYHVYHRNPVTNPNLHQSRRCLVQQGSESNWEQAQVAATWSLDRPAQEAWVFQIFAPWLPGILPPALPEFGESVKGRPMKYSGEWSLAFVA